MTYIDTTQSFAYTQLGGLSGDEQQIVTGLLNRLAITGHTNRLKQAYYEGKQRVRDLGISIPPSLRSVETVIGWPGTAVDILEEQLDFEGWGWTNRKESDGDLGLSKIYDANHLSTESGLGHTDALIYGVSFVAVGTGMDGEPNPLITVESPMHTSAYWDPRTRRIGAALTQIWDDEHATPVRVIVYLPNETIIADRAPGLETWTVVFRDQHRLGRTMMAQLVNRPRASDLHGRSEITRAVRAYTDNAVRTLLGMEVAREFYSAPQRYVLGASESSFVDDKGQPIPAWQSYLGRMLALSPEIDEDTGAASPLSVGQFAAGSTAPYGEQIRLLSQLLSAEAGIPATFLGFVSENPASADAINAAKARTIKRAERRQLQFGGSGWNDVAELCLLARDAEPPPPGIFSKWSDPTTSTRAAAADATAKLVGAGILPAQSAVTWEMLGLPPDIRSRLTQELGESMSTEDLLNKLAGGVMDLSSLTSS